MVMTLFPASPGLPALGRQLLFQIADLPLDPSARALIVLSPGGQNVQPVFQCTDFYLNVHMYVPFFIEYGIYRYHKPCYNNKVKAHTGTNHTKILFFACEKLRK